MATPRINKAILPPLLATLVIYPENRSLENNHSSWLAGAIAVYGKNKDGSENNFILPVIPIQAVQQLFWEQLKFTLNSCI